MLPRHLTVVVSGNGLPTTLLAERRDARARVITALAALGTASRADVARLTGLAPSTVSGVVNALIGDGLAAESRPRQRERATARGGRPPVMIGLGRALGIVVGIDFGKTHVRVAAASLSHEVIAERVRRVDRDRPAADDIKTAVELIDDALAQAGEERTRVVGVAAGLPAPVHVLSGEIGDSAILPGWVGLNAASAIEEALALPVVVENDANLGALAESTWGAARGCSEVAYLKVSTGVGAGIVIRGRVYGGAGGTAGEIGHTVVNPAGAICRCGSRGCLETVAGVPAILQSLEMIHGREITLRDVISSAQAGDPSCRRALTDAGEALGQAAANLCNLLNPHRIVVGGDLGSAGDVLLTPLRAALERRAVRSAARDVEVVNGELGDRAEVLGAVALAASVVRVDP